MLNLHEMTLLQLRALTGRRELGVAELTKTYLERIEALDVSSDLNAVAELDPSALAQAASLDNAPASSRELSLFGLPLLIKDNIDVAGLHTTAGSLALADNIAAADAPCVAALRRAGAVILGKTNMTEFANYTTKGMPGGYSSRGGQVKNAHDRSLPAGGSSTGSAVAVAAGFCAAALGTDTSFSVVRCATLNGVAGLKPARGALSQRGVIPIAHTLDSVGVLSHDLSDALLVYSALREAPLPRLASPPVSALRIAVNTFEQETISPAQQQAFETLFSALRAEGAAVETLLHPNYQAQRDIMRCEFRPDLEAYLASSAAKRKTLAEIVAFYEADPERMQRYGIDYLRAALTDDDALYRNALALRAQTRERMLRELAPFDACVMTGVSNAMHFVGLPSVALRLGMSESGAPLGVILYAADEARLLAAARTLDTPAFLEEKLGKRF